eukprot:2635014-Pleurochrysis_carterae.AAC.1
MKEYQASVVVPGVVDSSRDQTYFSGRGTVHAGAGWLGFPLYEIGLGSGATRPPGPPSLPSSRLCGVCVLGEAESTHPPEPLGLSGRRSRCNPPHRSEAPSRCLRPPS